MSNHDSHKAEWNEREFLTFLLLYAAHIDMEYTQGEKDIIQKLCDKSHYVKVRDKFRALNDTQCIELIQSYKGIYFPTQARTEMMLSRLDELFGADGDYSNLESVTRSMLQRIL